MRHEQIAHRRQQSDEERSEDPPARKGQLFHCPFQFRQHGLLLLPRSSSRAPVTLWVALIGVWIKQFACPWIEAFLQTSRALRPHGEYLYRSRSHCLA